MNETGDFSDAVQGGEFCSEKGSFALNESV